MPLIQDDWSTDGEGNEDDLPDGWQYSDVDTMLGRRSGRRARGSPDRETSPQLLGDTRETRETRWELDEVHKRLDDLADLAATGTIGACWGAEDCGEQEQTGAGRLLRRSATRLGHRTSATFLGEAGAGLGPGPPLSRTPSGEDRVSARRARHRDTFPSPDSPPPDQPLEGRARLPDLCEPRGRLVRQLLGQRLGLERTSNRQTLQETQRPGDGLSASLSSGRLPDINMSRGPSDSKMPPVASIWSATEQSPAVESELAGSCSKPPETGQGQGQGQGGQGHQGDGEGQEDSEDVQEAVLAVLECPVCRDFLQPPLKQCCNGHVVCFSCWPRLSISLCPACRAPFIATASLVLDGVLRALRFPCPNREHGCGRHLKMDDRAAHDQVCPYRPRRCPLSRCEWQGLPDALVLHCHSTHAPLELRPAELRAVMFHVDRDSASLDGVPTIVYHEQRLFSQGSSLFLFQSRYDLWRSKFFAHLVQVAGHHQRTSGSAHERQSWEVELSSPDSSVVLRMRSPVSLECPAQHGLAQLAHQGPGLGHGLGPGQLDTAPGAPGAGAAAVGTGLKLDLDVFNLFMEAGRYSLRIGVGASGASKP